MKPPAFFKSLFWLLALNMLVKPIWIFAIDRQVQNVVGNGSYGNYFALLNLSLVFLFVADAGLSNMITQRVAVAQRLNAYQLLQLKVVLLILYSTVCCIAGWIANIIHWDILLHLIIIQVLGSMFLFLRSLLTANQFFTTDAFFSIADKFLLIISCSVYLYGWWQPISVAVFLQLQIGSISFACMALLFVVVKKRLLIKTERQNMSALLRLMSPFAAIILLMGAHYRLDGFLLERIHNNGAIEAGIYAMAYRLLDAANMPGYLVASFLVPFLARNKNNTQEVKNIVLSVQHLMISGGILVVAFVFMYAPVLQTILYGTKIEYNNRVLQFCLAVLPAYYVTHIYGSILTAIGAFKGFLTVLFFSVVVNIALNLFFISRFGAVGCCIAALVSQYSCAAGCYWMATYYYKLPRVILPWLIYILIALIASGVFYLLKSVLLPVWITLAFTLLITIVGAIRLNFFKIIFRSIIQQKHA